MTNAVLDIRLLAPADWRVLREIRLRALIDSPHAFTSYHRREQRWSEREWRRRFDAATWVVAIERGNVIGIAGLVGGHPREPQHIESIWVAPTHRNLGVFRSLVGTVVEIARRIGLTELLLWVLEDNVVARQAYTRLGFTWTGERQPIGPGRRRFERRLRLAIRSSE
jgi:GNAT superfamily N-acetyltransferase